MLPKLLPIFLALVAVSSAISVESVIKKLNKRELLSHSPLKQKTKALDSLVRKRRDAEETFSSEEAVSVLKFFLAESWVNNKVVTLSEMLDTFTDHDTNLTLIGWQRVLDSEGKVAEIQTVQLVIPPIPVDNPPSNIVEVEDDDDDDDSILPKSAIKEMQEAIQPLVQIGAHGSVTFEQFDKDGELEALLYLDENKLYGKSDEFAVFNSTSPATVQEVSDFITQLKPTALGKPAVLKYDVDGTLIEEQSRIRPYLLGFMTEDDAAPDDVVLTGPQIIADISSKYPKKEIPKQLSLHFNRAYPAYRWNVVVNPNDFFIVRDIHIVLTYDNFDLNEESDVSYLIYGNKRKVTQ